MADAVEPNGIAEIKDKLFLSPEKRKRKRTVLVLKDGWDGRVKVGHKLHHESGRARVEAVEFLDGRDDLGNWKAWVCVMIDDEQLAADIKKGDIVLFLGPEEDRS